MPSASDFPHDVWPRLLDFVTAELLAQRKQALGLRRLADLVERAWDEPEAQRFARVFRAIADHTIETCRLAQLAVQDGDRALVAAFADSRIAAHLDGLAAGRWGDDFTPRVPL